jgi:hypothetical protein
MDEVYFIVGRTAASAQILGPLPEAEPRDFEFPCARVVGVQVLKDFLGGSCVPVILQTGIPFPRFGCSGGIILVPFI